MLPIENENAAEDIDAVRLHVYRAMLRVLADETDNKDLYHKDRDTFKARFQKEQFLPFVRTVLNGVDSHAIKTYHQEIERSRVEAESEMRLVRGALTAQRLELIDQAIVETLNETLKKKPEKLPLKLKLQLEQDTLPPNPWREPREELEREYAQAKLAVTMHIEVMLYEKCKAGDISPEKLPDEIGQIVDTIFTQKRPEVLTTLGECYENLPQNSDKLRNVLNLHMPQAKPKPKAQETEGQIPPQADMSPENCVNAGSIHEIETLIGNAVDKYL